MVSILFIFGMSDVFSQVHTLVLQPGPNSGIDCYFNSVIPEEPDPTTATFSANAWTYGGELGVGRSLLKFDLTQIPDTAVVLSAKLNLYYIDNGNGTHYGDNVSLLQKVTTPWNKMTANWNNQPTATTLDQVYIPAATDPTQNYTNIDVTTLVSKMVRDPATNFGFLFRLVTEESLTRTILASCDNPNPAGRPKLTIEYIVCPALVADFSYVVEDQNVAFTDQSNGSISWFWDFGDGFYSDLKNPEHQFNEPGTYHVCEKVTNACNVQTFCDSVAIFANSIHNHSNKYKVRIYPNPVHDVVLLYLNVSALSTASMELFTTQRSSLRKWEKVISPGNGPISLDIDGLSQGIYFLQTKIDGVILLNKLIIL